LAIYASIYGFAALGLDTFPVDDPEEGEKILKNLAAGDYAVIYITEALAAQLKHEIQRLKNQISPAVILIPGVSGNTGAGIEGVKANVEQAVGSDILFGDS
jgi:V/A-type H+-transporting ATPase subunit F